ncbi:YidC/Oxa1 family membrane protein insertase [Patescibacteria group bacterium]|nr:YidC/Oxa1 family membrane protein insertase [Patescibacteria group bacterium]
MGIFINFFSSILIYLDSIFGSIGITIIVFTVLIRLVLLPLTLPSIKSGKKIQELQPELKKLKEKHKGDKQAMALAQAQLYKSYNVNPLAGCLPQLLQFFFLIVLYQSIIKLFNSPDNTFNLSFLWTNLGSPDKTYLFPIIAGVSQFLLSLMISPATQIKDAVPNDSKLKKVQDANKKEEDVAEMAATMQQQMIFLMPVMTAVIALKLPSGLALYWIAGTIVTMVTQYFVSGWGGLAIYWNKYVASAGPLKGKYMPTSSGKSLTEIPKKINLKKASIFQKPSKSGDLASVLKNLDGGTAPIKPRNKKATKSKKTKNRKKK